MPDPVMIAIASVVAGKTTEALTAGAKTALRKLVELIRQRFGDYNAAREALTAAEQSPDDDRIAALAAHLERLAADDPDFADRLHSLWGEANTQLRADRGGIINEVSGRVAGNVVQARDIEGGVTFGAISSKETPDSQ